MKPFLLLVLVLSGCAAGADVARSDDDLRTTYGDLSSTLDGADLERWIAVRGALRAGFDRICGDTICSGDYSNLSHVQLSCSSTAAARKLKDCTWVLGGSIDSVDPVTGSIASDAHAFVCKIPVAGTATALLDALAAAGDGALQTPLPATGKSFYDGLVDCFAGASGTAVARAPGPYVELGESRGPGWTETKQRLGHGFDQICGDTFCEGDYANITPLGFVCAHQSESDDVTECAWTFAGSNLDVGAKGRIEPASMVKTCSVSIQAKASALEAALAVDDPLRAPLPGRTTTIYDALVDCL